MRKSWVRILFATAGAFAMFGQASAQSIHFWYNQSGDPAGNTPSVINVNSGSSVTLSVYESTTGVGALSGISLLFGYSTSVGEGTGATATDSNISSASFAWSLASFGAGELLSSKAGGGGVADGVSRPYGWYASAGSFSTFAGTADGTNVHIGDVTLGIGAAPGTDIAINIWSVANTDDFTSDALDANSNLVTPSAPYTATLHVNAVPEPATLAVLGLGAASMIRRRRQSK